MYCTGSATSTATGTITPGNYMMFHTMDPVVAIEDLKELHQQKKG